MHGCSNITFLSNELGNLTSYLCDQSNIHKLDEAFDETIQPIVHKFDKAFDASIRPSVLKLDEAFHVNIQSIGHKLDEAFDATIQPSFHKFDEAFDVTVDQSNVHKLDEAFDATIQSSVYKLDEAFDATIQSSVYKLDEAFGVTIQSSVHELDESFDATIQSSIHELDEALDVTVDQSNVHELDEALDATVDQSNFHELDEAFDATIQSSGIDAKSSLSIWIIKEFAAVGDFTTANNDVVSNSNQAILFQLQSKDLPSKRPLGKGLAGYGYETTWKKKRFARKVFVGVPRIIFEREAVALIALDDHMNIVKTYGWTTDKRSCSLVLEYMDDDLFSLLHKRIEAKHDLVGLRADTQPCTSTTPEPFDLPQAIYIMLKIATGMKILHEQRIDHGDLKTKNILVSYANQRDPNFMTVKVADFGLVCSKRKSELIVSRQAHKLDMVKWKAPEYLKVQFKNFTSSCNQDEACSESDSSSESESEMEGSSNSPVINVRLPGVDVFAADVYSFALICSHILTGNDPYPNMNWKKLGVKILSGLRPNLPTTCQPWLRDLLQSCWAEPDRRPSFSEIHTKLEHFHGELL
uniref:Protein kinase domain-containing protein n=1 Tax=Physcomitrium patens TaxID=3218 RepID=A0A2K1J3C2_PHYPA|nr:serine/threonine-protein kinase STY13-like [Physcomitrium patens]PNR36025.1 hypothetical protein PHYPA_021875 [Physcomitrium patens]|eukprot:XP_024400334.1 serine/threonine-protein kinase STY13-like [Physcomitrella patens]